MQFWLQSTIVKELVWLNAVQSAQPNLAMGVLGNLIVPFPAIDEQYEICSALSKELERLDIMVENNVKAVELLAEYRTALITAAVTGKIDVRNFKPNRKEKPAREAA